MSEVTFYRLAGRTWAYCTAIALSSNGNHLIVGFDCMGVDKKEIFEHTFFPARNGETFKKYRPFVGQDRNYRFDQVILREFGRNIPFEHDPKKIIPIAAAGLFSIPAYNYGIATNGPGGIITPDDADEVRALIKVGFFGRYECPRFSGSTEGPSRNIDAFINRAHIVAARLHKLVL